jgi:hypothetical protein
MIERLCTYISCVLALVLLSALSLSAQIITGEITRTVTDQNWRLGCRRERLGCLPGHQADSHGGVRQRWRISAGIDAQLRLQAFRLCSRVQDYSAQRNA